MDFLVEDFLACHPTYKGERLMLLDSFPCSGNNLERLCNELKDLDLEPVKEWSDSECFITYCYDSRIPALNIYLNFVQEAIKGD